MRPTRVMQSRRDAFRPPSRGGGAAFRSGASRFPRAAVILASAWLSICVASAVHAQPISPNLDAQKEAPATHARGSFDVKLHPQAMADSATSAALGRMSADKQFHGDLEATSKGEMLAAQTSVKGSAGYVALEVVSGALHGRTGTFVLQHSGTMTRGAQQLSVTVVPDSGTGQLVGLAGRMAINITDGKHSYDFEYTLAAAP